MITRHTLNRLAFLASALIGLTIAVLTLMPPGQLPPAPGSDKLHHLLAFAGLVFPVCLVRPRAALWLVPAAIAYGGLIELIQPHFGRSAEWGDFAANTAGAMAGALLAWAGNRVVLRPVLGRLRDQAAE